MNTQPNNFLYNLWYYALPAADLKAGQMKSKLLLGEPVLLCRNRSGQVFALRDICPHRGIPLSYGTFDGREVECCYHGWRFDQKGHCTSIPSLVGEEGITPDNIRVRSYPLEEKQGGLWIYMEDPKAKEAVPPPLPTIPDVGKDQRPLISKSMLFPCFIDHAVVGLMDPAHGPFIHTSWWWRSKHSIHAKSKAFGPSHLGFTMKRHKPSKNSFAYKLLGGAPETEISFQLPGIRIEHIRIGKHTVCNLTTVTPQTDTNTEITNLIYTSIGWLFLLAPLVKYFATRFLEQDRSVVVMQQDGLKYEQNLLLIRDADTQARWYYQLKNEFQRSRSEARAFINPVKDVILKWRS